MKKMFFLRTIYISLMGILFVGCQSRNDGNSGLKSARDSIKMLSHEIDSLQSKIKILSYPANQRLFSAQSLFNEGKYAEARKEIEDLIQVFPKSEEAKQSEGLSFKITEAEDSIRIEQERIKALGFKAITPNLSAKIGENTISFSNFTTSVKYTFDNCPKVNNIEEQTANRDNKYVLTTMTVTSTASNPKLPIPAVYSIKGGVMQYVGVFEINFALWKDYRHFLNADKEGVENDFAKTSTISFKLGCQVSIEILSGPYAVVLKKTNSLSRENRKRPWPNIYYDGNPNYPSELTVENFNGDYQLLYITNLK